MDTKYHNNLCGMGIFPTFFQKWSVGVESSRQGAQYEGAVCGAGGNVEYE